MLTEQQLCLRQFALEDTNDESLAYSDLEAELWQEVYKCMVSMSCEV